MDGVWVEWMDGGVSEWAELVLSEFMYSEEITANGSYWWGKSVDQLVLSEFKYSEEITANGIYWLGN